MQPKLLTLTLASALASAVSPAGAAGVTDQMIQAEATTTGNVLT